MRGRRPAASARGTPARGSRSTACSRSASSSSGQVTIRMPSLGERRAHRVEEHVRVSAGDLLSAFADAAQLFARGQAVGGTHRQTHLVATLQAGDPDHVELVEVRGEDREELRPLEQRERVSAASASTRALKSSQLSSRLRYRSSGSALSTVGAVAAGGASGAESPGTTSVSLGRTCASASVIASIIPHRLAELLPTAKSSSAVYLGLPMACTVAAPTPSRRATIRSSGVSISQRNPGQAPVSSMAPEC